MVSTLSRPKAAGQAVAKYRAQCNVSTLSRPKAAGLGLAVNTIGSAVMFQHSAARRRLGLYTPRLAHPSSFNTQPPEGGCMFIAPLPCDVAVSTLSRPKAAVSNIDTKLGHLKVSTLSRPKAAGSCAVSCSMQRAFQHSAARRRLVPHTARLARLYGFNTQPPEGGW